MPSFTVFKRKFLTQLFWLDAPDINEAHRIACDEARIHFEGDYQYTFTEPCPEALVIVVEPLNRGPRPDERPHA